MPRELTRSGSTVRPMILIWGFKARARTISTGEFFCSRCGADRSYALQQIRRWFTLFFIPLFPAGKALGEQVKCATCGARFQPEVLNTPTSASFSESLRGAMRVASMSMLEAGDETNDAARLAAVDASQLGEYLTPLAQGLNPQGKETFIEQVARVGLADGPLSSSEMHVLETLSAALGISAAHLRGIVVSTPTGPRSPSAGDGPPDEYRRN